MPSMEAVANAADAGHQTPSKMAVLVSASIAGLLGAVILYGVGFAGPDLIHNAAHDTRHSINTPCH